MKPTIADLLGVLDSLAPQRLAEQWDNVGLLVGNTSSGAGSILIGLDPTIALVEEAVAVGADTIITHHPVIFKPLSAIDTSSPAGRLLQKALTHDISIIGCHTNLDSAADGVNDVLAELLGLQSLSPLMPSEEQQEANTGLGRIGRYPTPLSTGEFLRRLFQVLQLEAVNIAGVMPEQIGTVAVCGGSGSDL
ncbi:MAG TPA: Nif3-like dinuclear metal center hexameric protein, partial [Desulfopila sp.]|nr:Nif3-like dinuclear metal center hexameric protein [Desulfopila sp.]